MKQGEEEWDSRIRSYIIDGTCRIRKSYSWQGNLNKSAVWWSQEGWPVHPYHSEDGPFKGTGKFSNLNLLLWTFMKYNMLISWLHAVTLFFFHSIFATALAFFLFQRPTEFRIHSHWVKLHLSFPLTEMFYLQIFSHLPPSHHWDFRPNVSYQERPPLTIFDKNTICFPVFLPFLPCWALWHTAKQLFYPGSLADECCLITKFWPMK